MKRLSTILYLSLATSFAQATSFDKNFSTKTSGALKVISVACPALKPYADFFGGFSDFILGIPPNGNNQSLNIIYQKLDEINLKLDGISKELIAFSEKYDENTQKQRMKDIYSTFEAKYDEKAASISHRGIMMHNKLGKNFPGIDGFLVNAGCNTVPITEACLTGMGNLVNTLKPFVSKSEFDDLAVLTDEQSLRNFITDLGETQNDKSTATRKVNYIALRDYYNKSHAEYYTKITAALYQSYQAQRMIIYLFSQDSKFHQQYITYIKGNHFAFAIDGISQDNKYSQNLEKLDNYYNAKLNIVEAAFQPLQIKSIYRDLPFANVEKYSALMPYTHISYFDGSDMRGSYPGNKSFDIPVQTKRLYDLSIFDKHNGQNSYVQYCEKDNVACEYISNIYDKNLIIPDPTGTILPYNVPAIITTQQVFDLNRIGAYWSGLIKQDLIFARQYNWYYENGSITRKDVEVSHQIGRIGVTTAMGGYHGYIQLIAKHDPANIYPAGNLSLAGGGLTSIDGIPTIDGTVGDASNEIKIFNPNQCTRENCRQLQNKYDDHNKPGNPAYAVYIVSNQSIKDRHRTGYQFGLVTGSWSKYDSLGHGSRKKENWSTYPFVNLMCVSTDCKRNGNSLVYFDGTKIYLKNNGDNNYQPDHVASSNLSNEARLYVEYAH